MGEVQKDERQTSQKNCDKTMKGSNEENDSLPKWMKHVLEDQANTKLLGEHRGHDRNDETKTWWYMKRRE